MSWPIASDYQEAVQNPRIVFADADLKAGVPVLTKLGLPRPITGAFASVYEFNCPAGHWAVRCFLRDFDDQQQRYDAISKHLGLSSLSCCVHFKFLRQGILVRGEWYPILKMEWIDGETLNHYIEKILRRPSALKRLARDWDRVMGSLHDARIAHGDLQHGNVLVSHSQLRLIDYDGMFVPELGGKTSHEEGHRNYQHPSRSSTDFGENTDNFSAWVVFYSILALSVEPNLWQLLNAGDECLLFRRQDFESPDTSKAFQAFESSGRPELQSFAAHLRLLLSLRPSQIPPLEQRGATTTSPTASEERTSSRPIWLDGHTVKDTPPLVPKQQPMLTVGATWIIDHLVESRPTLAAFADKSFIAERIALLIIIVTMSSSLVASFVQRVIVTANLALAINFAAFSIGTAFLVYRYRSTDQSADRRVASHRRLKAQKALKVTEFAINTLEDESNRVKEPFQKLNAEYRSLPKQFEALRLRYATDAKNSKAAIAKEKDSLQSRKESKLLRAKRPIQKRRDRLYNELRTIDTDERAEMDRLHGSARSKYIHQSLINATIYGAQIQGIGPMLKQRLVSCGIRTAADINRSVYSVSGIGTAKGFALLEWRRRVESYAAATSNVSASSSDIASVRQKMEQRRRDVNSSLQQANSDEQSVTAKVNAEFSSAYLELETKLFEVERSHDESVARAEMNHSTRKRELEEQHRNSQNEANAKLRSISKDLKQNRRELFGKQLDITRLQREFETYQNITFLKFLARACGTPAVHQRKRQPEHAHND